LHLTEEQHRLLEEMTWSMPIDTAARMFERYVGSGL